MKIEVPYKARKWAWELHKSKKRFIVMVLHRRAGKTTAVLNHLQRDAVRVDKSLYSYIGPTYKQTKRIAWDIAKHISRGIPGIQYNASELTVIYPNGSKLFLAGSDNIDALRGIGLWGCGLDEYALQNPSLFSEVISKCLADHLGYCVFLGTPKGINHFKRIYDTALKNPNDYTVIYRTIDDSLKLEEGEAIENLKVAVEDDRKLVEQGEMTQSEFDQEWYCSFEAPIKGAYYGEEIMKARSEDRIRFVPYDRILKVHTVWDLGVGQALGIGFYQRISREMRMIDYWEGKADEGLVDGIKIVQDRGYIYGNHFAPHDINAKELSTGKTRLDMARGLGISFKVVPKIPVDDGIEKGKLMFQRIWVDADKCSEWLDKVSQYRREYDENKKMFNETPLHDFTSHAADVHRYAAVVEEQMTNAQQQRESKSVKRGGMRGI